MEISIEKRVRDSFARQTVMSTIGASITRVEPGEVTIEVPFRPDLTQQHGLVYVKKDRKQKLVATMPATMIAREETDLVD